MQIVSVTPGTPNVIDVTMTQTEFDLIRAIMFGIQIELNTGVVDYEDFSPALEGWFRDHASKLFGVPQQLWHAMKPASKLPAA